MAVKIVSQKRWSEGLKDKILLRGNNNNSLEYQRLHTLGMWYTVENCCLPLSYIKQTLFNNYIELTENDDIESFIISRQMDYYIDLYNR